MKTHSTTPAHHKMDNDQASYGLALIFLTILIPNVQGVRLCALFTPKRK